MVLHLLILQELDGVESCVLLKVALAIEDPIGVTPSVCIYLTPSYLTVPHFSKPKYGLTLVDS